MKYKVGDEVLVKARIIEVKESEKVPYKIKRCSNYMPDNLAISIYVKESDIVPQPYMTAEEAWEIAEKISEMNDLDIMEYILEGDAMHPHRAVFHNLTPHETKSRIQTWKAKQINLGDEVVLKSSPENDEYKFFVTCINKKENEISGFSGFNGDVFHGRKMGLYKKTGRHIDITKLMKQVGEDK